MTHGCYLGIRPEDLLERGITPSCCAKLQHPSVGAAILDSAPAAA
ncbi:MAG: hypothetical protein ORN28_12125 [Rhodoferax sp.]|nr:hypothetical protein [Rhodoferax sp.]